MIEAPIRTTGDTIREILDRCARKHRVTVEAIRTAGRKPVRVLAHARQEACWRLRDLTRPDGSPRLSYPRIAVLVGYKDHTSALCAVRDHERREQDNSSHCPVPSEGETLTR